MPPCIPVFMESLLECNAPGWVAPGAVVAQGGYFGECAAASGWVRKGVPLLAVPAPRVMSKAP